MAKEIRYGITYSKIGRNKRQIDRHTFKTKTAANLTLRFLKNRIKRDPVLANYSNPRIITLRKK